MHIAVYTVTAKSRPHWRRSRSQQNITGDFLSPARDKKSPATKSRRRLFVDFHFDAIVDEPQQ